MTQQQLPTEMPIVTNTDKAKLIIQLVKRFEQIEADRAIIAEDEKLAAKDCKEAELSRAEVTAIKRMAKLRAADMVHKEKEKISAMATVSSAIGVDLFNWMEDRG